MIKIFDVVTYLRSKLQPLGIQVDGAAEYEAASDKSRLPMPCVYIALGDFSISKTLTPDTADTLQQYYVQPIRLIAHISNISDRTGKTAQDFVYYLKQVLYKYLYGYYFGPAGETYPLQVAGDRMIAMDRANYWHEFIFNSIGLIAPIDYMDPLILDNFDKFYADWNLPETDPETHPNAQDHLENLYNQ